MRKKNILFLMGVYPNFGGVEMVSTVLANKFIEDGYGVSIASFSQPVPEFAKNNLSDKCKLLELSYPVLSIGNIKALRVYIRTNQIDVIINQWVVPFFTTMVWKLAVKGTNCRIYSVHHNKPDTNRKLQKLDVLIDKGRFYLKPLRFVVREISRLSLSFCVNSSDKYILLSPSFIPLAQKYSRSSTLDKFISLANPVTIPLSENEQLFKEKEIICVGRIEYNQKRTFRVVEIWKELEDKYQDWKLTIVGDGDDRKKMEQLINDYNLKRVKITGFVNPVEYYKRASIMIMTSEYEGFPLVLTEGMSYGVVPVVYDSFEAVHDLIINAKDGYIVERPFNVDVFSNRLKILMNSEVELKRISHNAILTSRQFSIDSITQRWYNLMNNG